LFIGALLVSTSLHAESLPVIQLPDYVISGVEKATAVNGERLTTSATMNAQIPGESGSMRPRFVSSDADAPPEMPGILAPLGNGNIRASVLAGMRDWMEADASLTGQTLPVGYRVGINWKSPISRTFADPRNLGGTGTVGVIDVLGLSGAYARDVSTQSIIETEVITKSLGFNKFIRFQSPVERNLFSLSLTARTTPILIGKSSLNGLFEYIYCSSEGTGDQSSSLDHLALNYSRMLGTDRLESKLELSTEAVGEDTRSHYLLLLSNQMYRRLWSDLNVSVGLNVYIGNAQVNSALSPIPPANSGVWGSTSGIRPTVEFEWTPPVGGISRIAYLPQIEFITHHNTVLQYPMLDTSARGATVEGVYRFLLGYQTRLTDAAQVGVEIETRADRYKPYLSYVGADDWRIVSRRSEATVTTFSGNFSLPRRIGLGGFIRFTDEQTNESGVTGKAPFTAPVEVGADFTMPIHKNLTLAQELSVKGKAPADFAGTLDTKGTTVWDVSLRWHARPDLTADFGIHNLFDQPDQYVPGYEADHFALWAKVEWRGKSPFGH